MIKGAVESALNWFKANWPTSSRCWTDGARRRAADQTLGQVQGTVMSVVNAVKGFVTGLANTISDKVGEISGAITRLAGLFDKPAVAARAKLDGIKNAVGAIADFISGQIGQITAAINRVVDAIKKPINAVLPPGTASASRSHASRSRRHRARQRVVRRRSIGGQTISTPDIQLLARGGIVTARHSAVVGEAGPEAVIPLSQAGLGAPVEVRVFIGDRSSPRSSARRSSTPTPGSPAPCSQGAG